MPSMMPNEDDDLDPRVKEFLQRQLQDNERQRAPQYRRSLREDANDERASQGSHNMAALLADSASLAGTIGGKRADATGMSRFAAGENQAVAGLNNRLAQDDAADDKSMGIDAKVFEYLQNSRDKKATAAANADYRSRSLAQQKTQNDIKNDLDRQRLAKMGGGGGMTPYQAFQIGHTQREDERKRDEESQALAVPEFDRTGEVKPTAGEATKSRDSVGTVKNFNSIIDGYVTKIDKNGPAEFVGEDSGVMASLKTSLAMELKNLYELGALNASDYATLSSQLPDPTSASSVITSSKTAIAGLKTLKDQLNQKVEAKLASQGYKPKNPYVKSDISSDGTALAAPQMTPEDEKAVAWAKSNPNDPRAKEIKKLHGIP